MLLESIQAGVLAIPFKQTFKHASAERSASLSLWVEARTTDGLAGFGEGCPRGYVTAESLTSARDFITAHRADWLAGVHDLASLGEWVVRHRAAIDANPAAWAAVELALLDVLGKHENKTVECLLGLPELGGDFRYSAVLGDASPRVFETQLSQYLEFGMRDFKIKLAGDHARDLEKVQILSRMDVSPRTVRADANNLWHDAAAAAAALSALEFPFFALEEPLRAGDYRGMRQLATSLDTRIILDESLLRLQQLDDLEADADRWIVNVRVSKMGGLLRALEVVRAARLRGVAVIVGAHVGETSLLTRAGLSVAQGAHGIQLRQEGAFGTRLLTRDVVAEPLMFGAGGVLNAAMLGKLSRPGFGLGIISPLPGITMLGASGAGPD
jgi:L-alanine-DL-glutamate epimerase-like enolase superfamily enzyme